MLIILGINSFHADASAALVRDGMLIAAVEEERFRRIKHWAGFPSQAIDYCLREAGVTLDDVDHIAFNQDSRANFWPKLRYVLQQRPNMRLLAGRLKNRKARAALPELLERAFPAARFRGKVQPIEHHVAHLSSAFHVSPFQDATVLSVDGFGDFASTAWGIGHGGAISVEDRVYFPHSLGIFYQALTQYLGFPYYGDEYKIMGLAPYGTPSQMEAMQKIVRLNQDGAFALDLSYFRHHKERVPYQWENGMPEIGDLFAPALEDLLGPRRKPTEPLTDKHRDIAASIQVMYEDAFFHLLTVLQRRHGLDQIAIAGGCGANSVANGKVRRRTKYQRVYVQSAAGDAGGAIGAAYALWHREGGSRGFVMDHAYWGPSFERRAISELMDARRQDIEAAGCSIDELSDDGVLCERTAAAVADGKVIGWFQGRMEWGPRALGNRSIICDPRRANIKEILNAKIKRRESFRPFAPSVMAEAVSDWFEEDDAVPFMMQVFQIRQEKRALIPAVTHVDGSGRLQTVERAINPRYHRLIEAFFGITGVPMVLNTSFNENEPVVCTPQEALDCFLRTKMDVLVLGDTFIERRTNAVA